MGKYYTINYQHRVNYLYFYIYFYSVKPDFTEGLEANVTKDGAPVEATGSVAFGVLGIAMFTTFFTLMILMDITILKADFKTMKSNVQAGRKRLIEWRKEYKWKKANKIYTEGPTS